MSMHQQLACPATTPQVNGVPQRLQADCGTSTVMADCWLLTADYFLPGFAGTAFFSATLWSRELPYELRKRLPLAVRLSPLPMMCSLMSVKGLVRK